MEIDKIYNEDCLVTLGRMEDNSIDLIITSPPYNKSFYSSYRENENWHNAIAYDCFSDNMKPQEYEDWQKGIIRECLRVLKPTGSLFYNHKDLLVGGELSLRDGCMTLTSISRLSGTEVARLSKITGISLLLRNIYIGLSRIGRSFTSIKRTVCLSTLFGE